MSIFSVGRVVALGAAFLLPTLAQAASNPYTATLAKPLDVARDVIAGATLWHCEGSACTTKSSTQNAGSIPACHQLVLQIGAVTAYGSATRPFDADSIARCNGQ